MYDDKVGIGACDLSRECIERISRVEGEVSSIKDNLLSSMNGKFQSRIDDVLKIVDAKINSIQSDITDIKKSLERLDEKIDVRMDMLMDKHDTDIQYIRSEIDHRDKRLIGIFATIMTIVFLFLDHVLR